ncbi:GNAT family N-acetyltransferase [Thalassotalea mangrovi]|uniref:GNAT family N-acetyltransferase n=1 Tax=Thalassotalea mangrovi TaxID=2572245 RepID=A0A4U1BAH6_9GAMM|nr:GNAT family N-acetyltransferase [Thalassotalea mangrovi]TKB47147.1 GNAT family N-acetyltransferase [Thalassotalea mangrovi]
MLSKADIQTSLNHCQWQTARLQIRNFQATDLATELSHNKDPRIMRYIADIEDDAALASKVKDFLKPWQCDDGNWLGLAVCLPGVDEFIGMVCLRFESLEYRRVEIGYRFHPDHQGKGYAKEAVSQLLDWLFNDCQVEKVVAYCVQENQSSFRLMEKLGMQREGCLRQHSTLGGRWHDELVYGLLHQEWHKLQSGN